PLPQIAVARLLALLLDTAPVQLEVLPAPVDWRLTEHTVLEPDVLVTTAEDTQGKFLAVTPLLVVEVGSPRPAAESPSFSSGRSTSRPVSGATGSSTLACRAWTCSGSKATATCTSAAGKASRPTPTPFHS